MSEQKRILIIDDEEDLRDILAYQFKARGYEVTTAEDGIEGLKVLKGIKPDLIVLDLNMPRMGGIEFYQSVCGANGKPAYSILILTARANTKQLFLDFDIDGFMTKPFEIDQLIREAEIIVRKKEERIDQLKKEIGKKMKNIFVVDQDPEALEKITAGIVRSGYQVRSASSGIKAIEKMMVDVPEVALVNLGLSDIPGDIVVQRLMRMSKTMNIQFILYLPRTGTHDNSVLEGYSKKSNVLGCIEYAGIQDIVDAVERFAGVKVN